MVVAQQLDYFVEADVVELASLMLVDSIYRCDELAIAAPLAILLAFPLPGAVPSLIRGLSHGLALLLVEVCSDSLLARGVDHCEVE